VPKAPLPAPALALLREPNPAVISVVMPSGHPGDAFLCSTADVLAQRFRIGHPTLQIETGDAHVCRLAPDHVV